MGSTRRAAQRTIKIEYEQESKPTNLVKIARARASTVQPKSTTVKYESLGPPEWQEVWHGIELMRKNPKYTAAVDTMGCAVEIAPKISKSDKAYHCLIGLMMSSQTKDEITHATLKYLVEEQNLSVPTILKTKESDLNEWIKKVGFHNKKAVYIKKTTE